MRVHVLHELWRVVNEIAIAGRFLNALLCGAVNRHSQLESRCRQRQLASGLCLTVSCVGSERIEYTLGLRERLRKSGVMRQSRTLSISLACSTAPCDLPKPSRAPGPAASALLAKVVEKIPSMGLA